MELMTADGIAKRVQLSPFYVRRLGARGAIKRYKAGRAVRFDLQEILRWMEHQGAANLPNVERAPR